MTANEIEARHRKATALVAAWVKLAAPADGVAADPAVVLALALDADPGGWRRAEALAGTRAASETTQALVLSDLYRAAHPDAVDLLFAQF